MKAPGGHAKDVECRIELSIAMEHEIHQFAGTEIGMTPCRRRGIESVHVWFGDVARFEKIVVLFRARNRTQNVEGCDVGMKTAKDVQVFANAWSRVIGKSDDV